MALLRSLEAGPALLEKDNDIELASFVYLDFQKTFDNVPHKIFPIALKASDIGDGIMDRMEKWLTYRRRRVIIEGEDLN